MFNQVIDANIILIPKTRVSLAVMDAFTPFGWSRNKKHFKGNVFEEIIKNPVSIVTEPLKALDREVIQPVYREVIQPVGHALEKIGQGIAKDPLTFVAQAAAIAAAPFTAGQSLWALPVIAAASTAAKGGSLDQILTATAISAATAAVGGGFGLENSVGGLIMNGMQTGGSIAANTATFSIAGTSITASTASAIAAAGQGMAMGAVAATGAAITGRDPFQAALPSLVGSALGIAGNQIAQAEFFAPIANTLKEVGTTVGPVVSKAMTGVASAMVTGAITGRDMTQVALASLANTAISGAVSATNLVADFFRNDSGGITNMGAATQSIVADLLGSVAATMASGGKLGVEMGAQFLTNSVKTLVPFLNPQFDALATNVQLTYKDAEAKVNAVNEAANNQQSVINKYNADAARLDGLATEVNGLLSQRDSIYNAYNAATTQSEVDRLRNEFNAVEAQIAAKTNEYNALYGTLDSTNAEYLDAVKRTEEAQQAYFEVSKSLGDLGTQLSNKMNDISKALTTQAATQIDPNFNADEYKELNNLGPGVDAATHYMSAGKDQGLFTNFESATTQRELLIDKATEQLFRANGWGSITQVPTDVYDKTRSMLANFYGYNMDGLNNFTVNNLVQQSKMPATWYAPMWDEDTKTVTDAKVLFNGGENGQVVIADNVLPDGMNVADFFDVYNGNANITRGSDGTFYWTTNSSSGASKIYDAETGEIVNTTYSTYFADREIPEGAYDISRDEQGRVVGYRTKDGGLFVTIFGANNPNAEYKDYGTDIEETDPLTQMFTYSNVTQDQANLFSIESIVDASRNVVDYMQKDASDIEKLQISTIVKSAGSVMQDVGTVIGDLAVTIGLSKTNDTTLATLGKKLEGLADSKTPEQYKAAMKEIKAMRDAAQGTDIVSVNAAIAEKYPDLVGVSVFGGELFEEVIQSGVGKAAFVAGGALAATLGAPALISGAIATAAGIGTAMAMDFAESYRGAKEEMYTRMYDVYKSNGYSDALAAQMADAAATKAGVMNGIITSVINGATPGDLNKVLFGGKASPAQDAITNYFVDKVTGAAKVAAVEFGEGLVEGALQGAYNEALVYSVDPTKADYWKGISDSAMLESIIGAPVAAGTYGINSSFEAAAKTFTLANDQFSKAITNPNITTLGELGAQFKQWDIDPQITMQILPDIVESNPSLTKFYATPQEYAAALENNFGFTDNAQVYQIVNQKFDDKVTTTDEAKTALLEAGLVNVTNQDAINAGVIGSTTKNQAGKIESYADQNMVAQEELDAAARRENYTYQQEQLDSLIGRGVEADVISKFVSEIDPLAVTESEAKEYFKNLGYDNATADEIAQFVKSVAETQVQEEVGAYVDPRQVTREEATQFYQELGYVPTEKEIQQFILHGKDIQEAQVKTDLGGYVDPRMVDSEEAKQMLADMGLLIPLSDELVQDITGQYMESELAGKAKEALPVIAANATYAETKKVADLVGKPTSQVTQADFDFVNQMAQGQADVNLAYDTNNDGVIDQTDATNIQNQLEIQQNENIQEMVDPDTGVSILVDITTGQQVDGWIPSSGSVWAPTGIYAALEQQKAQAASTAKAQAKSAKTAQQNSQFGQLMGMLFQAPDAAGQQVTVKTPDPAKINYIYDWSSIFATPSQAGLMPSPYGALNTVAPQQQAKAANQPMFNMASGFAGGGIVNSSDIQVGGSVDDLINILKGN